MDSKRFRMCCKNLKIAPIFKQGNDIYLQNKKISKKFGLYIGVRIFETLIKGFCLSP